MVAIGGNGSRSGAITGGIRLGGVHLTWLATTATTGELAAHHVKVDSVVTVAGEDLVARGGGGEVRATVKEELLQRGGGSGCSGGPHRVAQRGKGSGQGGLHVKAAVLFVAGQRRKVVIRFDLELEGLGVRIQLRVLHLGGRLFTVREGN